jgi:hypothetical protein
MEVKLSHSISKFALMFAIASAIAMAWPSTPSDAALGDYRYDNLDPGSSAAGSCGVGNTIYTRQLKRPGGSRTNAHVDLRYNSTCRVVWSRLRSGLPGCQPGNDYCGSATATRNNDGARTGSVQGHTSGRRVWWSRTLNDANKTSYASATITSGPYNYWASTPSY